MEKSPKEILCLLRNIINNKQISEKESLERVLAKLEVLNGNEEREFIKISSTILDLQIYDIIFTLIGQVLHYAVVVKLDPEFGTIWVIPITSDCSLPLAVKIKESRLFESGYYCCYLQPIFNHAKIKYCGIADNKKEVDLIYKSIKNYYKQNFK